MGPLSASKTVTAAPHYQQPRSFASSPFLQVGANKATQQWPLGAAACCSPIMLTSASSGDVIAIPGPIDGVYHFFNPLYKQNSLLGTQAMMHGVSNKIEGTSQPYTASAPTTYQPDV